MDKDNSFKQEDNILIHTRLLDAPLTGASVKRSVTCT